MEVFLANFGAIKQSSSKQTKKYFFFGFCFWFWFLVFEKGQFFFSFYHTSTMAY